MNSESTADKETETVAVIDVPKKRAPTLWAIIIFKLLKGSLFFTLAISLYCLSDNDLPKELQNLMRILHAHPGNKFWQGVAVKVGQLTEVKMLWAAAGTLVYSLFSLVEGTGLIFRVSWAGWLAIGESAFFIPIEIVELMQNFSLYLFGVMLANIFIVWYLFQNRERLFRHHHHH